MPSFLNTFTLAYAKLWIKLGIETYNHPIVYKSDDRMFGDMEGASVMEFLYLVAICDKWVWDVEVGTEGRSRP